MKIRRKCLSLLVALGITSVEGEAKVKRMLLGEDRSEAVRFEVKARSEWMFFISHKESLVPGMKRPFNISKRSPVNVWSRASIIRAKLWYLVLLRCTHISPRHFFLYSLFFLYSYSQLSLKCFAFEYMRAPFTYAFQDVCFILLVPSVMPGKISIGMEILVNVDGWFFNSWQDALQVATLYTIQVYIVIDQKNENICPRTKAREWYRIPFSWKQTYVGGIGVRCGRLVARLLNTARRDIRFSFARDIVYRSLGERKNFESFRSDR